MHHNVSLWLDSIAYALIKQTQERATGPQGTGYVVKAADVVKLLEELNPEDEIRDRIYAFMNEEVPEEEG